MPDTYNKLEEKLEKATKGKVTIPDLQNVIKAAIEGYEQAHWIQLGVEKWKKNEECKNQYKYYLLKSAIVILSIFCQSVLLTLTFIYLR